MINTRLRACYYTSYWPAGARCVTSSEYYLHPRISFTTNIHFGDTRTSANIGFGHGEYSRILVGGHIAAPDPIYALYVKFSALRENFCHVQLNVRPSYDVY